MTDGDLRSLPLVFVDNLDAPVLDADDHHHLTRSLRVRSGRPIAVSDGRGRWRQAILGSGLEADDVGPVNEQPPSPTVTMVAFALTKGGRPDLAVQKLTELGVSRLVPMVSERTVVVWSGDKVERNRQRHQRIAREAAMQSRNTRLPDIWPLTPLATVIERHPQAALAEPGGPWPGTGGPAPIREIVVGPEGGFTGGELAGRPTIGLPGHILRTETAAIVAGVVLSLTAHSG